MSLQVRLRHALGERWLELPERGIDLPLIVGRASTADIQVPSVTVEPRHCVLFVHEGHWVVQGAGGTPGTYVNGSKVAGATFLQVGDRITLGGEANAPGLEIDPNGAAEGRAGYATAAASPAPAAVPHFAGAPAPAYVPPPAAAYVPGSSYPASYPGYPAGYGAPGQAGVWGQDPAALAVDPTEAALSAAAASSRYTVPRRRPGGGGLGGFAVLVVALGVAGAGGYWLYQRRSAVVQVAQPGPTTRSTGSAIIPAAPRIEDTSKLPPSVFDQADGGRTATRPVTKPRPVPPEVATSPAGLEPGTVAQAAPPGGLRSDDPYAQMEVDSDPVPPPGSAAATQDPADVTAAPSGEDPAWKQVEAASFSKDEARAILLFDDYARTHPNTGAAKLQEYKDKALDRIWFERLEQLVEQRESLTKKIEEVDRDLAQEPNEAYKKRVLVPLKQQYAALLRQLEDEVSKNMKYEGKTVPNLLDDAELDKLRKSRDPQFYGEWKERILSHIRRTHGGLPWAAGKSS